jgi:hypothetical protein
MLDDGNLREAPSPASVPTGDLEQEACHAMIGNPEWSW